MIKKNQAIPGAVILIDDVRQTRLTNKSGVFKIKLDKAPEEIAAFSPSIGIKKIKYLKNQNDLVIQVTENNDYEVIGTNNKQSADPVQFQNIYDYLRGRVPGVIITQNNRIFIRGFNTVNGSTVPLFIVNGVQVDQDFFGNIVPMQIKSVQILKGPETAAYGSRGANGVIIVQTN
ncbi:MAG: TonB-dependent receptor plug domain-containing protein [Polaribacter sp.]|nr:TonB-dependent receptor plug domain-containing protein [Polaribacter sp.]